MITPSSDFALSEFLFNYFYLFIELKKNLKINEKPLIECTRRHRSLPNFNNYSLPLTDIRENILLDFAFILAFYSEENKVIGWGKKP